MQWSRRRQPEEVPAAVAAALSDYCRRSGVAASAAAMREALSCLGEADDFRVRALADSEPSAPLGPFAAVDVISGAPEELAGRRERCGYYEVVQALVEERGAGAELSDKPKEKGRQMEAPRREAEQPATISEKITPRKRHAQEREADARKALPRPRGRFSQLPSPKRSVRELSEPASRGTLEGLFEQHGHRLGVLKAIAGQFESRGGRPPSLAELMAAADRHGLRPGLERREREVVLSRYREHRGASGRAAWAMGLSLRELEQLVESAGLSRDVEELREHFRREALSSADLRTRLDLLGRSRYLADLGIEREFQASLAAEVRALLEESRAEGEAAVAQAARRVGVSPELLERAAGKLGILSRQGRGHSRPEAP
ncbi:MAG: hypothetical protein HYZ28_21520 [Myxococcales bacterium]|nr:hypothetical protein [Myxococcales bacterium]